MPRISQASHVEQAMRSWVQFGGASVWMCEEDNEMYALLEGLCESHPSGVWIVIHHFLEQHLEMVGEHLLSQGEHLKQVLKHPLIYVAVLKRLVRNP